MKNIFKILLSSFVLLLFYGCGSKQITIKSLHSSNAIDEKINAVLIEEFKHDYINQTAYIKNNLSNIVVKNKKVFNLKNRYSNIDAILTGEVLESSAHVRRYHKDDKDETFCKEYASDKNGKRGDCIKYKKRIIPCEDTLYTVKTLVELLAPNEQDILFSKVYTKSKRINECYDYKKYSYYHNFANSKKEVNSSLAQEIADEILTDISPHYVYRKVTLIDSLDERTTRYMSESFQKRFDYSIELIKDGLYELAKNELTNLDFKIQSKSYEILYNLGIVNEALGELENARKYYNQSYLLNSNRNNTELIDFARVRIEKTINEKKKVESQIE